jgi:hypothetical protein
MKTISQFAVCFLAACGALWGQAASTAQINGTVRDASGLGVPDASIKATQTATGLARTANSGPDGAYVFTNLPIGPYLLEVTKDGFSKYAQSGILLQIDSNPTIDAALKVGSVSEQVLVQADAAMVETHSTGVGQVVDSQRVVELPLNGRNATELIFLAGMANGGNNIGSISSVRNYPTVVVSVAGGQGNGMTYLLDGANHNDAINNLNLPLPFPDALQEFKVETSALPAQYGLHAAAAVNAVTKSGTNQFHGDLFEFLRNGDFNARDFFAPKRDTLKRNQFGGTLGGPVRKEKLFFFLGYQGTKQRSEPSQNLAYVPTAAILAGDFTTIASPACNAGRQINLPASLGFANNRISPTSFNSAALKIESRLPVSADPTGCGRVNFGLLSNSDEHLGLARLDYQMSPKHSLFGRFYIANLDSPTTYDGKNALTLNTNTFHDRVYSLALGDTYLIGANIVSSFRVGANRTELPKIPDNFATWKDLGVNANSFQAPNPRLSVTGNGFNIGSGSSILNIANTGPNYNLAEDISLVKGAHQLGFGVNYLHTLMNLVSGINATGLMTFNGSVSGMPLADFLLGNASAWAQGNANGFYNRQHYIGLYAQDSWKLTPRLTVSYGVRWEPYLAIYSKYGMFNHFDAALFAQNVHSGVYVNAPAGEVFPGDPQYPCGNSVECNKFNTFVPRVGLVWDPKGDGRMTVRAAYGMFTDRANIYSLTAFGQDAPIGNVISLTNVNLSNPWANYPGGNPLPIPLTRDMTFPTFGAYVTHPFDLKPTYIHQWNLSVQRQIGKDWLVTVNYLGNSTIHFRTENQLNPAVFLGLSACTINGVNYPTCSTTGNTNQRRVLFLQNPAQGQLYSIVSALDDGGTASYEGLYLSAQRRFSHGVSMLANYTWSHCISDVWNDFTGNNGVSSGTPNNRRADRGNCATSDQRQVFNLSMVAQTPRFSGRALRWLAGDWQVSPILKIKSAQFFTVVTGVDNALNGQQGTAQRPNLLLANPYTSNQSVNGWSNPLAFAAPAPGTYGNLGAYNLKGPGVFQLDLGLSRTFQIWERKLLQVRAEAFNLPNHLNPSVPVAALNSGSFGKIQSDISGTSGLSAGDPRIVQLALKFVF